MESSTETKEKALALLLKHSVISLVMRVFQLCAQFGTTVLLARVIGAAGFGVYSYAVGWTMLLAGFTNVGFSHSAVREVAHAVAQRRFAASSSFIYTAYVTTIVASLGAVGIVLGGSEWFLAESPDLADAARFSILLVPALATVLVTQGVLRGKGAVLPAQAPEMLVMPATLLLGVIFALAIDPDWLNASNALGLYAAAIIAALIWGGVLQVRLSRPGHGQLRPKLERRWISASLPFLLVLSATALNAQFDILMVGASRGSEATGIYALASRLSAMPMIAITAISMPLSPMIAGAFSAKDQRRLRSLVHLAAIGGAIGTTVLSVLLVGAGPWVLGMVGPVYAGGLTALTILCVGRVGEAWLGPAGTVLAMTQHAWLAGSAVALGSITNVTLNLLLIGPFGMEGAAAATAAGQLVKAVLMWYFVRRLRGIGTSLPEAVFSAARRGRVRP